MQGVEVVLHTATLHKPHIATHPHQDFIDTNITGTVNLLEEAVSAGVKSFIFTSSTSVFGRALIPPSGAPAAWITEDVTPIPKNIYGITKLAAEHLCALYAENWGISTLSLRYFTVFGDEIELAPTPDQNYTVEMIYRMSIPSLGANAANWLLALAPDLYLYGALLESAPYIKEDGRIQTWGLGFTSALNDLNNLGLTSTFNAGPMTVRVSGQVF